LDLSPLQIDRTRTVAAPKGRRRRGRVGWIVAGALLLLLVWLFFGKVRDLVDRVRLLEVVAERATRPNALAATAIAGTAANGYVVASKRAALSADTPGRIVEMNVEEGTVVKKGDVVARLYAEEYRAALTRAEADLASQRTTIERWAAQIDVEHAETERMRKGVDAASANVEEATATLELAKIKLERAEKMVADDVESRETLDDARAVHARAVAALSSSRALLAGAESAVVAEEKRVALQEAVVVEATARLPVLEATREEAKATLEKTEVRAPFDGVVVLKDAEVGEVVSPNSQGGSSRGSVATMVDFASLEVQVEMPERSISAVKKGAAVKIFLDAWPDHVYAGRVTRIWPVASRAKATIEVRATFDRPDERLRPEMGARVVFLEGEPEPSTGSSSPPAGVLVPAAAIVKSDGKSSVFVIERDRVREVEVTTGEPQQGRVLVTSGLKGEEQVVVDPPPSLSDGDRVRVKGSP
jgi:RND family efflux transporter MFP subunit